MNAFLKLTGEPGANWTLPPFEVLLLMNQVSAEWSQLNRMQLSFFTKGEMFIWVSVLRRKKKLCSEDRSHAALLKEVRLFGSFAVCHSLCPLVLCFPLINYGFYKGFLYFTIAMSDRSALIPLIHDPHGKLWHQSSLCCNFNTRQCSIRDNEGNRNNTNIKLYI